MVRISEDLNVYFRSIGKNELLTRDEERYLGWRWINDNDFSARNELVERNLALVVFIAKNYMRENVDFEDLIAFGNLGLLKSAKGYDPARGFRFSTYAYKGINDTIRKELKSDRIIKLPRDLFKQLHEITLFLGDGFSRGENLGFDDYARKEELGDSQRGIINSAYKVHSGKRKKWSNSKISNDSAFHRKGSLKSNELRENFWKIFDSICEENKVSERDREMFIRMHGLNCVNRLNSVQIGRIEKLTRERVRQICEGIKGLLKKSSELSDLIS